MSILSFPRLNFNGVFTTNPCTANNDDVMGAVVNRDSDTLGPDLKGMTDAQVEAFLREPVNMSIPGSQRCLTYIRSGWNLFGNHFTTFDNTTICSVVTGPNPANRFTSPQQDPLVGQPMTLLGSATNDPTRRMAAILCDLDSTGLVTTQLWVGGIQIGSGGPTKIDPSQIALKVDHDTRGYQNWLNFMSTVGPYAGEQNFVGIGCVMQFGIPRSALPASSRFDSPGLRLLLKAAHAAQGLVVRFRCYEVQPGLTSDTLASTFGQGQSVENPAMGYLVGTIGVWGIGEPASEPAGRVLHPPYPRQAMNWVSQDASAKGGMPPAPEPWNNAPALIGNAVAHVTQSPPVISLDLVQTFPKFGFRDPDGPQKPTSRGFTAPKEMASVGTVELAIGPNGAGPMQPVATVDYGLNDYNDYFQFGGIVDVPYDPTLYPSLQQGRLALNATSAPNAGVTLLQEETVRLMTDDRAAYMPAGTKNYTVNLKVSERGGPTKQDTKVYLFEYINVIVPEPNKPPNTPPVCADGVRPNQTVAQEPQHILAYPRQVVIPAGQGFKDWYPVKISASGTGATIIAYQLKNKPFTGAKQNGVPNVVGVPGWSTATYSSIRVFDDDDFSALYAKGELQWKDVYDKVLRYYYLIYPVMSTFIPLNMPDGLVGAGALVKQRMHPCTAPGFYTTHNMPVTRQMSPAKVKLVLDFISQEEKKKATGAPSSTAPKKQKAGPKVVAKQPAGKKKVAKKKVATKVVKRKTGKANAAAKRSTVKPKTRRTSAKAKAGATRPAKRSSAKRTVATKRPVKRKAARKKR